MKKGLLLIIFLLSLTFVSSLSATQSPSDAALIPEFNQPAKITLTINDATPGTYNIYTLTAVKILPSTPFYLNSGTNKIDIYVYPTKDLTPYNAPAYSFSYDIRNVATDEVSKQSMVVEVIGAANAFQLSSDANSPDSDSITFFLRNNQNIDLKNVKATFKSLLFDSEQTFDIGGNEKKDFSIPIKNEDLRKVEAGTYPLTAQIKTDRGLVTVDGKLLIEEKKGVQTTEEKSGIIVREYDITKTNYGNLLENVSVQINKNVLTRLLTSFNIEPDSTKRIGLSVVYFWDRQLKPAEVFEVKTKTNYLVPLLVLIIVVAIIYVFNRYMQKKVEVEKSVVPVKTKTGQFALKIKLVVMARNKVENVSLIDRIPGIAQIYEKFGAVRPTKIDTRNRRIQWDIGNLAAGEVREFNYMVYSSVGVVGKFSLPQALIVYEENNTIHESESNAVYFLAEQVLRED